MKKLSKSDLTEIETEEDPQLLLTTLYAWNKVTYLDYVSNLVLRAHELEIKFLLYNHRDKKSKFNGEELVCLS